MQTFQNLAFSCVTEELQFLTAGTEQRDPPISQSMSTCVWPRAGHLSISPAMLCRVVSLEHTRLAFVCLRECISSLLPHPLHLSHFSDRLLELFHPTRSKVRPAKMQNGKPQKLPKKKKKKKGRLTLAGSPECYTSEFLGCDDMSEGSTCASRTSRRNL